VSRSLQSAPLATEELQLLQAMWVSMTASSQRVKKTHFLTDAEIIAIRQELRRAKTQREVARRWRLSDWYISQLKHYQRRANAL
jgi:hypothetical protein